MGVKRVKCASKVVKCGVKGGKIKRDNMQRYIRYNVTEKVANYIGKGR